MQLSIARYFFGVPAGSTLLPVVLVVVCLKVRGHLCFLLQLENSDRLDVTVCNLQTQSMLPVFCPRTDAKRIFLVCVSLVGS